MESNKGKAEKYRGVRQRSKGKFIAEIWDGKIGCRVCLGTYESAIEAAKAYDKAAFEFRGTKATLNFPLDSDYGEESNAKKRRKDVRETMAVVNPMDMDGDEDDDSTSGDSDDDSTSDTIFKPHIPGPSSPPSVHVSGRSVSGRSPPIGSNKDDAKGSNFNWTDEYLVLMCNILNKHLARNGRNSPFKWDEHLLEFQKKVSHHNFKTLAAFRSKYEAMKQRYNLWKSFKNSENGLPWDRRTGKLDCSDDWWDKKIKENPEFKKIQKRQPSRELQEAWDELFENVAPSAGLKPSNYINLEDGDEPSRGHTPQPSQFINQGTKKPTFSNDLKQEDTLTPNHGGPKVVEPSTQPKPSPVTCKVREPESAARFKEFVASPLKMHKTCSVNEIGNTSIRAAISVINSMVEEGLMASCSELWCFAVSLCEDNVKREVFLSLPDNHGRLAWLQYKQKVGH